MTSNNAYRWSSFRIRVTLADDLIIMKSTLTGAVINIDKETEVQIQDWFDGKGPAPEGVVDLMSEDIALIVPVEQDEFASWKNCFLERRNNHAHIFTLYFLPTIQCQLCCGYCFEKGANRGKSMRPEMVGITRDWIRSYFDSHPEIDTFRLVLFGGEPLLRKEIVKDGLETFQSLARERGIEFWSEIVSNGELLDEETAAMLSHYSWRRVQITLDGPEDVHNARRHGVNKRPTFANIFKNIKMLLSTDYICVIDIRVSVDFENVNLIPEFVRQLADLKKTDRINLSLGLITPTFTNQEKDNHEAVMAEKILLIWEVAKECGFKIPDEFVKGPWCVAIARHSAVLQPDGGLQKCFCTVGREEYNFSTVVDECSNDYLKDSRFEHFDRTDLCVKEKCPLLPLCGGGCIHDSLVSHGGSPGFDKRFCQKTLIEEVNRGLIRLTST